MAEFGRLKLRIKDYKEDPNDYGLCGKLYEFICIFNPVGTVPESEFVNHNTKCVAE